MGRAKERFKIIQAGGIDPGPDDPIKKLRNELVRGRKMGTKKIVEFIVEFNEDGTSAVVTQNTDTDLVSLTYIWVKIMESIASQAVGENKGLIFIRRVYSEFKSEFGMS
jgi:hypothetical protein